MGTSQQKITQLGSLSVASDTRVTIDPELLDEEGNRLPVHVAECSPGQIISYDRNPASPTYGTFDLQNTTTATQTIAWSATYYHSSQYNAAQSLQADIGSRGADPSAQSSIVINAPGNITDTLANIQAISPLVGQTGTPTDSIYDLLTCSTAGTWRYWFRGYECFPPALNNGPTTWVNQGAAVLTQTNGEFYLRPDPGSGENNNVLVKGVPFATFQIDMITFQPGTKAGGFYWRESGTGRMVKAFIGQFLSSDKLTNATTFNSSYFNVGGDLPGMLSIMRMADDGVNRTLSFFRPDGVEELVHSVSRTDFLTADQVGWGLNANISAVTPPA
jgi:hypothetical protein